NSFDEISPAHGAIPCEVKDDASFRSLSNQGGNVRFGSKADMCSEKAHVRFTPNSDRESGLPQTVMSAFHPKADMCSALPHVRFGPIADMCGAKRHVCFSPGSGHSAVRHQRTVLAKSDTDDTKQGRGDIRRIRICNISLTHHLHGRLR